MGRLVTLFTGQWADLEFEVMCKKAKEMGYEGLEIACWGEHLDISRAVNDDAYVQSLLDTLEKYDLKCEAIGTHIIGQCVGDAWDIRLNNFAPASLRDNPEGIRAWATEEMKNSAIAARKLGAKVVTGFTGSPIWKYLYSFPQTTPEMVEDGFNKIVELWTPILDVFKENNVLFALEVHPGEIAFDYYTTKKLLEKFADNPTFGLNFDPSHLIWQGVTPHIFLNDLIDKVYPFNIKDT